MDGSQEGYDYKFLKIYKKFIQIPIIISGGYGNANDIAKISKHNISGFAIGNSLHHFEHSVQLIKKKLSEIHTSYIWASPLSEFHVVCTPGPPSIYSSIFNVKMTKNVCTPYP